MHQFVQISLNEQKPIEIIYLSSSGEFTQRIIIVKKISGTKILAFCFRRNMVRSFTITQILSASRTKELVAS